MGARAMAAHSIAKSQPGRRLPVTAMQNVRVWDNASQQFCTSVSCLSFASRTASYCTATVQRMRLVFLFKFDRLSQVATSMMYSHALSLYSALHFIQLKLLVGVSPDGVSQSDADAEEFALTMVGFLRIYLAKRVAAVIFPVNPWSSLTLVLGSESIVDRC